MRIQLINNGCHQLAIHLHPFLHLSLPSSVQVHKIQLRDLKLGNMAPFSFKEVLYTARQLPKLDTAADL